MRDMRHRVRGARGRAIGAAVVTLLLVAAGVLSGSVVALVLAAVSAFILYPL